MHISLEGTDKILTKSQIFSHFQHVDHSVIEELKHFSAANIGDNLNRNAAVDADFQRIGNGKCVGQAFTVSCAAGDNLYVYIALEQIQPNDVLIIDAEGFTNRAIVGEILVRFAQVKGAVGVIVNGSIRDVDVLKNFDIPIYFKGISPNGPYKNGPGSVNQPIALGGKVINPGDIIVADEDGIVSFETDQIDYVIEKTKQTEIKEAKMLRDLEEGKTLDTTWAYEKIKNLGGER